MGNLKGNARFLKKAPSHLGYTLGLLCHEMGHAGDYTVLLYETVDALRTGLQRGRT